ncbi:probable ubiquitin-like-specific protease 2B isoform X2 [Gossypium hirsutum]|uniref:Probable ubiquitin-like-specific protease 2B isoform X2 n=1 Tax=Gossypium hirsutum TaxID=3635 RepID=A0A1U8PCI9_GOSHI|nr:probable ubiquitin-like-specific protease 2B isoform X2 [Gossypium hirsutum]
MDNIPCLDVDAIDGDCSCDVTTPVASLGSDEKDCILKEGNPKLNVSPESKSTLSEQQADLVKDSHEPRCTFSDMEPRDSCPEVPSPGKRQLNCALSNSPLINKPVDMASDANESMAERSPTSPSSDVAEDDVSLNGDMSDHCFGHIPMDNLERTVVICPDYVLYQNDYHTGVSVIFSPSGVKIEGSTVSEHQRTFSFESRIDDIISINCRWFQRVGYMTLKMKVLSKVAIEAENACDTSADEELKFTVIDPRWSEKHAAIISLNFQYQALWNIMPDPLAEMDGDDSLVQRSYFPNFDEPFEEVIYPKGDIDAVSISKRDVDLLLPETFVNDTIIDFYINFFFRKLADLDKDPSSISDGRAAFLRVRKWTRKLDMFGKDYIFIPVNFSLHWSLIVICHSGEVAGFEDEDLDKSSKVPCILHMDSIKGNHAGLKNLVQSYLWEEWKERHKETSEDLSSKFLNLRFVSLELPQQENSFDCGLFLLHYLELFLAEAPSNFNPFKITKFSNFLNLDWFPPTEASLKRTLIQKLIFELLEIRSREMSSSDCSDEPHSSRFPEEIENGGVEFVPKSVSPEVACHGNLNSQASQGIEMTLLASSSMRNVETVNDSGLVLREFFEPGVTAGSLLGQFQSFDQQQSYYNMNGAVSPREQEDVQTGQQFVYLASGETSFPQFTGITSQACEVPYSSSGFVMGSSWNPGISLIGENKVDTSHETSCTSDDDDDIGIIENNPIENSVVLIEKRDTDQEQSQSVKNVECLKKGFMPASIEVLETSITDVPGASEDTDKIHDKTEDADLPSKTHSSVVLHQNPGAAVNELDVDSKMVENMESQDNKTVSSDQTLGTVLNQLDRDSDMIENEASCDEVQTIIDDLPSKDNSMLLSDQNPSMVAVPLNQDSEVAENKEAIVNDSLTELSEQPAAKRMQQLNQDSEVAENKEAVIVNDSLGELSQQPAAKRMRLTPSLEEKVDS